jgi:hypothetical protein
MFDWLRRRREARALVDSDAQALIEHFGNGAYLEAHIRQREAKRAIGGDRTPRHWERVKEEIERQERALKQRAD